MKGKANSPTFHIVLHQPEIPFNTGSVGRTCVAAGAKLWLVRPLGFRLDHKHVRRAGLDYWQFLTVEIVDDWQQLKERLNKTAFWYFSKHGERPYLTAGFSSGCALVFGNETQGLPPSILSESPDHVLRIPIQPQARSLNLSNAVAIATFEALRQTGPSAWH